MKNDTKALVSFFKILHVNISILDAGKKDFSIIVDENYEGITDHVFLNICDLVSWTSEFGQFPCVRTSDINIFFEWKLLFYSIDMFILNFVESLKLGRMLVFGYFLLVYIALKFFNYFQIKRQESQTFLHGSKFKFKMEIHTY